ncbi:hypothetical protein Q1695_004150 [Nippostrongylus brasiliensis]|nr:hypothetical protein Q1695_004150 [Nippostrongylus brasiliensis]
MKESLQPSPCVAERPTQSMFSFKNRLLEQENSPMNQTYTIDTTKRDRLAEFNIDEALSGYLPRSRSSDQRRRSYKTRDDGKRAISHSMFSASCKLPSIAGGHQKLAETRVCTMRPWSRTQDELRKYKEALNANPRPLNP